VSKEMVEVFKKSDRLYKQLEKNDKVYKSSAFVLDKLNLGVNSK
jgi:hypothetical protein